MTRRLFAALLASMPFWRGSKQAKLLHADDGDWTIHGNTFDKGRWVATVTPESHPPCNCDVCRYRLEA